jgi:hypothetical protein
MPCCRAVPVKPGGFGFLQLFATLGNAVFKLFPPISLNSKHKKVVISKMETTTRTSDYSHQYHSQRSKNSNLYTFTFQ